MEDRVSEKKKYTEKEKAAAAYALNMCTVSVSQIIDYHDLYVLEQEYDAILNNLNLKNMPKDQALLDILTELLNTITFFRIQDLKKQQIEKEYQNRLKDAVWSAAPSFNVFASGNPIAITLSLATTVGTGYMNYRKEKVMAGREKDKADIELQIAAIEQFNGLRRELFTTAWKLADEYEFEDNYRITERQIHQYNEILMDPDDIRKFERLDSIKDSFVAYPPFWYNLGHAANVIACSKNEELRIIQKEIAINDEESIHQAAMSVDYYKEKAKEYFQSYDKANEHDLLREDPVASSCYLEYIDLLNPESEKDDITKYLEKAEKYAGKREDILELCAFGYLKIGETDKAAIILTRLVNEDYNKVLNGQIISRLYVDKYIQLKSMELEKGVNKEELQKEIRDVLLKYNSLSSKLNWQYLFPMPIGDKHDWGAVQRQFDDAQKMILAHNYYYGLKTYFEKLSIEFNHILPVWSGKQEIGDFYYQDTEEARNLRRFQARQALTGTSAVYYQDELYNSEYWVKYLDLLERMVRTIANLNCITDIEKAVGKIKKAIGKNKRILTDCHNKLRDQEFIYNDYVALSEISFFDFTEGFIKTIFDMCFEYLSSLPMAINEEKQITITDAEANLRAFCVEAKVEFPEIIFNTTKTADTSIETRYFIKELLGEDFKDTDSEKPMIEEMVKTVEKYKGSLIIGKKPKTRIILRTDAEFRPYFSRIKSSSVLMKKTIAVIDDVSWDDRDLVIATDGVYAVVGNSIKPRTEYSEIKSDRLPKNELWFYGINEVGVKLIAGIGDIIRANYYRFKDLDMDKLFSMLQDLKGVTEKYDKTETTSDYGRISRLFASYIPSKKLLKSSREVELSKKNSDKKDDVPVGKAYRESKGIFNNTEDNYQDEYDYEEETVKKYESYVKSASSIAEVTREVNKDTDASGSCLSTVLVWVKKGNYSTGDKVTIFDKKSSSESDGQIIKMIDSHRTKVIKICNEEISRVTMTIRCADRFLNTDDLILENNEKISKKKSSKNTDMGKKYPAGGELVNDKSIDYSNVASVDKEANRERTDNNDLLSTVNVTVKKGMFKTGASVLITNNSSSEKVRGIIKEIRNAEGTKEHKNGFEGNQYTFLVETRKRYCVTYDLIYLSTDSETK